MFRRESVQVQPAISDWPTQLAVLKIMFNTEDLNVKYIDDEDDEVKIENHNDYEFAQQIASSSTNNTLRLILKNSRDEIIGKTNLQIDQSESQSMVNSRVTTSSIESMRSSIEPIMPPPPPSSTSSTTSTSSSSIYPFTPAQIQWLNNYLDKFKVDLLRDIKERVINKRVDNEDTDLISFVENETTDSFESKVKRLFAAIIEARIIKRSLKAAYLEEELLSTGAFMAEFIKDENMPDGSQCEPGMRFEKTWLIKNTGKLDWSEAKFPVRLVCIAGNIAVGDDVECVNVPETRVEETASISVALIAPPHQGTYFSEWVLCCHGFKFGPRIWCTIQVTGNTENEEQLSLATSIYSEKTVKFSKKQMASEDLDDEFVVIPDCFDLDKKWKIKNQSEAISNVFGFHIDDGVNSSINPSKTIQEDLIMLNSGTTIEKDLSQSEINVNKSSLESSIERINPDPYECEASKQTDNFVLSRVVGEKLSLSQTQDPKVDFEDDDDDQIEASQSDQKKSVTPVSETTNEPNHVNSNISQALGAMKDALSNLGRPSYFGSIPKVTDVNVDDKMKKLISMGFANRKLNLKLLEKHNNNLDLVIQNLLEITDNNWAESR